MTLQHLAYPLTPREPVFQAQDSTFPTKRFQAGKLDAVLLFSGI